MNTKLFEQIKKAIRAEPLRMNMDLWITRAWKTPDEGGPKCGTVGCIAGWAMTLHGLKKAKKRATTKAIREHDYNNISGFWHVEDEASKALEIAPEIAALLFHPGGWPSKLFLKLKGEYAGTPEYAEVVCEAIDSFVKSYPSLVEGEKFE